MRREAARVFWLRFWRELRILQGAAVHLFYEAPRGIDFIRMYDPYDAESDSFWYETRSFKQIKETFEGYVDETARLLDAGCGKGYTLWCAGRLGFRNVTGIELDRDLKRIAEKNMERLRAPGVNILPADAAAFRDLDRYRVIYLFNPFVGETMKRFKENVEESLYRRPRDMTVIYANPLEHKLWDESALFTLTEMRRVKRAPGSFRVFYYKGDGRVREKGNAPAFAEVLGSFMEHGSTHE